MQNEVTHHQKNGYHLHTIQSDKFKTISIVIKLRTPLNRETITKRALLPYVLQQGTERYPDFRSLRGALDDLYGAVLSAYGSKKGENHIFTLRLETANESYLNNEEEIFAPAVKLLRDLLFNPKVIEGAFDPSIVKREKQTLKQKITSIVDDKMSYANERLIDEMCAEEPYHYHLNGYEEDLESINEHNLYEYYQTMLEEDVMDIYVLGDIKDKQIEETINSYFSRKNSPEIPPVNFSSKPLKKVDFVVEKQEVQQAKLHLGYRTNKVLSDPDYYALQVFNGLFGGFPSSKLFLNVREKHSLAYYAASRLESHKGLLFVFSGIDPSDYEKARNIIEEQMEALKNGDFTEDQLSETKELIINQYLETMDSPSGMIELLFNQTVGGLDISPEQVIDKIRAVTTDQVVHAASEIELDTVYLLTGTGGEANE